MTSSWAVPPRKIETMRPVATAVDEILAALSGAASSLTACHMLFSINPT
jgi:hypothetical protein